MKKLTITVNDNNWSMLKDYYHLTEIKYSAAINKCMEKILPQLLKEAEIKE